MTRRDTDATSSSTPSSIPSEALLRSTFDSLAVHVAIVDDAGKIVAINQAWRSFGEAHRDASRPVAVGTNYLDVNSGEILAALQQAAAGDAPPVVEYACHVEGEPRFFEMHITSFDYEGRRHLVVSHRDISSRVLAMRRADAANETLRAVMKSVPDFVLVTRGDGTIEFINRTGADDSVEVIGTNIAQFISATNRDAILSTVQRARESATDQTLELDYQWTTGRNSTFACRIAPFDGDRVLIVATDVTNERARARELAETQEQLRQAQKLEAVARLAGGVAHDFNNMLTAMRYFTSSVIEQLPAGSALLEEMAEIDQATTRAASLTRQLLAFSRSESIEPRVVDLNDAVASIANMLERVIGEEIRLVVEVSPTPALAFADPGHIDQILTNLIINASDAIHGSGTVTVTVHTGEVTHTNVPRDVRIEVRDTGVGMTNETLEHIFEPFFTTKEEGRGTGLGLATVRALIEQHGGHVEVQTEIGKGSSFTITFPETRDEPAVARTSSARPTSSATTHTILVIEDDPHVLRGIEAALHRAGYDVHIATTVDDARAVAATLPHLDLVVTDARLPDGTGAELLHELRRDDPSLPALLITGYTTVDGRSAAPPPNVPVLLKPFTPRELTDQIAAILSASRSAPNDAGG